LTNNVNIGKVSAYELKVYWTEIYR